MFLCSIKKELKRLLTDRRIVLTSIVLPGLILYIMYSFMGEIIGNINKDNLYSVKICGKSDVLESFLDKYDTEIIDENEISKTKEKIENGEVDLLIIFPDNIDSSFELPSTNNYNNNKKDNVPNIQMFYASSKIKSQNAYYEIQEIFNSFESQFYNIFDINGLDDNSKFDLSTEKESSASMISTIMPMILIVMMFSGCMAVASESIAGEKERGTLSTILVTSIDRRIYAVSKVLALSIVGFLTALSTTIAIIMSMPKLMQMQNLDIGNVYTIKEYIELGIVSVSTIIFIVSIISIVSAAAKNVKQAGTYMMPLMVLTIALSMSFMFIKSDIKIYYYLVPLLNSYNLLLEILSLKFNILHLIISIISNLVFTLVAIFVLQKMFNSEKIIYN